MKKTIKMSCVAAAHFLNSPDVFPLSSPVLSQSVSGRMGPRGPLMET